MSGATWRHRLEALALRIDQRSARERLLSFAVGVTVVYVLWQSLLMDPLAARGRKIEAELATLRERSGGAGLAASSVAGDPLLAALARVRALEGRRAELDRALNASAGGYVPPERMAALVRSLLSGRAGLKVVRIRSLAVESLSTPAAQGEKPSAATLAMVPPAKEAPAPSAGDPGPFLHPLELVLTGDYASIVSYLRALEQLPARLYWRELDLAVEEYPQNRVRIVIGTLSLSRDWMSV
jgi:MSHA biogenesis protein MshJ